MKLSFRPRILSSFGALPELAAQARVVSVVGATHQNSAGSFLNIPVRSSQISSLGAINMLYLSASVVCAAVAIGLSVRDTNLALKGSPTLNATYYALIFENLLTSFARVAVRSSPHSRPCGVILCLAAARSSRAHMLRQ